MALEEEDRYGVGLKDSPPLHSRSNQRAPNAEEYLLEGQGIHENGDRHMEV